MAALLRWSRLLSARSAARRSALLTVLILGIVPLAVVSPLPAQSLKKRLDRTLDVPPLDRHLWGIAVADSTGRMLYGRNAERLFIPASNTKLVVTAVAASLLPADFTVRTSVYATGPLTDGTVAGHLVLYGRGDPSMDERCFGVDTALAGVCAPDAMAPLRQLAHDLWTRGVRTVSGNLVGDGSYFEAEWRHPSWEHSDLTWWYAAPVSGLGFATNSVELTATATSLGAPAALTVAPWLGDLSLDNRTRTVPEGMARTLDVVREPGTEQVIVTGDVPVSERPARESVAVTDPNRYAVLAFRQALAEVGIAVLGGTESTTDSLLFQQARRGTPLAEVESRPLKDWLFPILNTSQNWYAEMLLKQLGRQFGQAGSWHEGLAVERRFLIDRVGIDSTQFSLSDGSGLSAINLVTPAALVRLLTFMRHQPSYLTWSAGLPVSGQRGSLRARFLGGDLEGKVMAKTGSISTVNSLSGYLTRRDGRLVIFSIQANHHTLGGRNMIAAIDSVVGQLAR
jgi:D-alanyl-D-alanine carboxypeptidase/D-alanyl-D-alanine-endopeptidase (penicillin-binding protein 4)